MVTGTEGGIAEAVAGAFKAAHAQLTVTDIAEDAKKAMASCLDVRFQNLDM